MSEVIHTDKIIRRLVVDIMQETRPDVQRGMIESLADYYLRYDDWPGIEAFEEFFEFKILPGVFHHE